MAGTPYIDGEDGATIKCSVKGGGPYTFSGKIQARSSESDPVTFTITNGNVNADKLTGTASISVFTPQLGQTNSSAAGACTLTIIGGNVKPGSLWAQAACPLITDPDGHACSIGVNTTFVFENCDGS